jgi:hypothetical protein
LIAPKPIGAPNPSSRTPKNGYQLAFLILNPPHNSPLLSHCKRIPAVGHRFPP